MARLILHRHAFDEFLKHGPKRKAVQSHAVPGLFHGGDKIYQSRDRNGLDFAQAFSDSFLNRRSYEVRSSAKSGWPLRALTMDPEIYKSRARNRPI